MNSILYIIGNRTAEEVLEAARDSLLDKSLSIEKLYYAPNTLNSIVERHQSLDVSRVFFNVAIADVVVRKKIVSECRSLGWIPRTVIHPTATVSRSALVGDGSFIGPSAVISCGATIGEHCIVHIHSSIGHDSLLGEMVTVLPGACVSGNVRIGDRSLIGSNAFLNAGIEIGNDVQIDALTYVARSVQANMLLSVRSNIPLPRIPVEPQN